MFRSIAGLAIVWAFCSPFTVQAADVNAEVDTLLQRMHAGRQQLNSGVVVLSGVQDAFRYDRPERCYSDAPVDVELAFDWRAGLVRYDMDRVWRTVFYDGPEVRDAEDLGELTKDSEREAEWCTIRLRSVLTPDLYAFYHQVASRVPGEPVEGDTNVAIWSPGSGASVPMVDMNGCFDVRSVGLFNMWVFEGATSLMGYEPPDLYFHRCDLDIAVRELLKWPAVGIERDGDLTTIRFEHELSITLNEAQGFTPVEYREERGKGDPVNLSEKMRSTVKWEQVGDVWVPVNFMIEVRDADGEDSFVRRSYTMDWSFVNQSVPESSFDFRNFTDVQEQTCVMDNRSGEPVQIGEWSGGEFVPLAPVDVSAPPALAEPSVRSWNGLVVINVAVLISLVGGSLVWRMLRQSSNG